MGEQQRARLDRAEPVDQRLDAGGGPGIDDHAVRSRRRRSPGRDPGEARRSARLTGCRTIQSASVKEHRLPERDRPWVMRTYAGHSTAKESNALYRKNLAKGQTGLSIAFDLPTQTGYDPDHELSRGEVGKVGVSIAHKGDMHTLLDGIPLDEMNTSMTINATAAWLLALYMTVAEENGVDRQLAPGHDPERHHQGVPLARDLRVPARAVDAADRRHDRLHGRRGAAAGTRSTSARTTSRRPARRRSRRSPTRSRRRRPCSTASGRACPRRPSRACSAASRSS